MGAPAAESEAGVAAAAFVAVAFAAKKPKFGKVFAAPGVDGAVDVPVAPGGPARASPRGATRSVPPCEMPAVWPSTAAVSSVCACDCGAAPASGAATAAVLPDDPESPAVAPLESLAAVGCAVAPFA